MSWLNDIVRVFRYSCGACKVENQIQCTVAEHDARAAQSDMLCEECGSDALEYLGFMNVSADEGGMPPAPVIRTEFSQNGRIGIKVGNKYISKSKLHYKNTGEIKNFYTPEYEGMLQKEKDKNEYLLKTEANQRRANVKRVVVKPTKSTTAGGSV